MAATDITYGGLDPVLYTPDFSFLKYSLDKKSGQYEQGLKSASSAYNSLKRELSDPVNAERRDQYLKDAQGQLQKIASADLSLQQNVNLANSIFDPLATDKAFLIDSYYTDVNKKELAKMDQWANSSDPEERRKFNPEIQAWLRRDLDSIKNGKGDISNYKVEGRKAFAYMDPQQILDKAVKDKGFKYKVDEVGQPYIVTTEGGKEGRQNYNAFAKEVLASDPLYQRQLGILAQNSQESILDLYKKDPELSARFANAKPDDIYKDYADRSFNDHREAEKKYIDTLNANYQKENADVRAYINANSAKLDKGMTDLANGVKSPEADMYADVQARIARTNNSDNEIREAQQNYNLNYGEGATLEQNKKNYVENFSKNPASWFKDLRFKNDITVFSNIKSTSVERTIKEDRAYVDMMVAKTNATRLANDIADDIHDNLNADQKLQLEKDKLALKGTKTVTNADGTTSTVTTEADIVPVDIDATQVVVLNQLTKLKDQLTVDTGKAINAMAGNFGGISILRSMGMPAEDVTKLNGMFTRYFGQEGQTKAKIGMTKEEGKILSSAASYIKAFAKNNPNSKLAMGASLSIGDLPTLLSQAIEGYKPKSVAEKNAMLQMGEYKTSMDKINLTYEALNAGKAAVIQAKQKDPAFAGMFIRRGVNGPLDLINEKDIIKQIPTKLNSLSGQIYDYNTRSYIASPTIDEATKKQIANEYINGTLKVNITKGESSGSASRSGGTGYGSTLVTLSDGRKIKFEGDSIFKLSPDKYKELTKRINTEVQIPGFEDRVGKVVGSPFYKLNGEPKQQVINTLGHITPTNSQIMVYSEGSAEPTQVTDDATLGFIRNALADKTAISEVSLMTSSPTNAGGQAVEVKFAVDLKKGDGSKNPLAGRSFFFPITPTAASQPIFKIFDRVNEVSEFSPYQKKGETYRMDTFQAAGARAEIIPTAPGATTGLIYMKHKAYNPMTKSYSDTWEDYGEPIEYDLGSRTFTEIKQFVNDRFILPYVDGTISYQKNRDAVAKANGIAGKNASDVLLSSLRN